MILVRKMQLELSIPLRSDSSRFRSPAENGIYIDSIHAVESIGWTQSPSGVNLHKFISFLQLFWLTAAVSVALNILADICKTCNSIDAPIKTENLQSKSRYFRINCTLHSEYIFLIFSVGNIYLTSELGVWLKASSAVNRDRHRCFQTTVCVLLKQISKIPMKILILPSC